MVLKIEALGGRGRHLFLKVQRGAAGLWRQRAGSRRLRGAVLASSTPDGEHGAGERAGQVSRRAADALQLPLSTRLREMTCILPAQVENP